MVSWLLIPLLPFAVYRVAFMIAQEDGPYDVFATMRYTLKETTYGKMMACVYCNSVWIAGLCLLKFELPPYDFAIGTLAVSALAIWIHHGIRR